MGIETGSPEPGVWKQDDRGNEVLKRDATFVAFARVAQDDLPHAEHRQQFNAGSARITVEAAMESAADELVKQIADWGWYIER